MRTLEMQTRLSVMLAVMGLLLAVAPLWAHHAFQAEFDQKKPVSLQGKVTGWGRTLLETLEA